jgi:hypothetical protein
MSDTINIGGITVSKFYLGGSSDVKIYLGTTKLYPHLQEPCFAVVDDISEYTDREFVDVFNEADGLWYKLNNLNQYEEYGVYGSGRTITTYEGKLTIDGDYEYIYSGASWVNVGEVSGGTATLPDVSFSLNYNAKKYDSTNNQIPQTSGQLQNVDAVRTYGSGVVDHSADGYISVTGNTRFVCSGNSGTYLNRTNTQTGCTMTIVSKAKTNSGYSILTNRQGNGTTHLNWMYRQYADGYMKLHGQTDTQQIACSTTEPNILSVRTLYNGGVKSYMNNWSLGTSTSQATFAYLNTGTRGGALFCDYSDVNNEFWQGDFYWVYMSQNVLTDEQVQQVIDYNEGGGGEPTYPLYYDEMQDPPNNVSFSSMTEAEEYECPWVGMNATIDGARYIFSGDSQSGYEWVENPSRLPSGYTEVEYITSEYLNVDLNDGAYILTNYYPTESTRLVIDFQAKSTTAEHRRLFGAGHCCQNNIAYVFNMEQKYTASNREYTYRCGSGSTWVHTNIPFDLERHTVDFNNNGIIYLDDTQIGQRQTTPFTTSYSLFLFTNNNDGSAGTTQFFVGRIYSCKMYESDTLIRDFVPCTRDSDNKVGLYDVVNDVFYTSATNNQYTAGNPV